MRLYVILDRRTKREYAITNKLWLARLYYMQRYNVTRGRILIRRKSKQDKSMLQYNSGWLHYFSGFVLSNDELTYINTVIDDADLYHMRKKYTKPKFQKMIDSIENDLITQSINTCIYRNREVIDQLSLLSEWEEKVRY